MSNIISTGLDNAKFCLESEDVIMEIEEITADTFIVVQPPEGQSWLIKDFFASGDGANEGCMQYYDGVNNGIDISTATGDYPLQSYRSLNVGSILDFLIDNLLYARVRNDATVALKTGLIAIRIT